MEQHKINYPNISITLLLLIAGIGAGITSKIPNIIIPYQPIITPDWIHMATLLGVGTVVAIVAVMIYMLMGTCGMTGRMR